MNAPFQNRLRPEAVQLNELGPIAPPLERRRLQCYLALMVGDIVSLFAGFAISGQLYLGAKGVTQGLSMVYLLLPIFLTIAIYNSTYSIDTLISAWRGMVRAVTALAIAGATIIFIAFYTKSSTYFSRVAFTLAMILSAFLLLSMRLMLRRFVTWRCGRQALNELVIDDGGPPVDLPGALRISAADFGLAPNLGNPHANDRIGLVLRNIDRVVVTCPPERRAVWAMTLKGANILGEVIDDAVVELGAQGARVAGGQGWLLVSAGPLGMRQRITKRLLDVSLSVAALVVLSPVLLLVVIAIMIEDGRPVFFVQQRLGRGNRFFNMYKFRSMARHACDQDGTVSTARGDGRITRVAPLHPAHQHR